MDPTKQEALRKVPEVTLIFWIIKILATTLGETGGDAVSMSMKLGYLVSTGIFGLIFILVVLRTRKGGRGRTVVDLGLVLYRHCVSLV